MFMFWYEKPIFIIPSFRTLFVDSFLAHAYKIWAFWHNLTKAYLKLVIGCAQEWEIENVGNLFPRLIELLILHA